MLELIMLLASCWSRPCATWGCLPSSFCSALYSFVHVCIPWKGGGGSEAHEADQFLKLQYSVCDGLRTLIADTAT